MTVSRTGVEKWTAVVLLLVEDTDVAFVDDPARYDFVSNLSRLPFDPPVCVSGVPLQSLSAILIVDVPSRVA